MLQLILGLNWILASNRRIGYIQIFTLLMDFGYIN